MKSRLPKGLGISILMLVAFTSLVAMPVMAQQDVPVPGAEPIWVTVNASATGNYPGGDELFTVFVVNSAPTLTETETVQNMTLTAPFGHNFGIGLPSTISPGQSLLSTIHLQIPTNFTQKSFTANLVVHATLNNGTTNQGVTLTGTANVNIFAVSGSSTGQTTTTQSGTQTGTVSSTLFALGVAAPSIVVIILLALLVQARGRPKPTAM